jgi:hypothetical protein
VTGVPTVAARENSGQCPLGNSLGEAWQGAPPRAVSQAATGLPPHPELGPPRTSRSRARTADLDPKPT